MRRMISMRSWTARILTLTGFFLAAGSAGATPAIFAPFQGFEATNLGGLPSFTIDASVPFLDAGETGMTIADVELTGSTDLCILVGGGDTTCQASPVGVTQPYSVISSFSISAVNTSEIEGPFTLFLRGLAIGGDYAADEVTIELDPSAPIGLDMSAVPGFSFDGTFTPFVHIIDEFSSPADNYVGWLVQLGAGGSYPDRVTFRYEVNGGSGERAAPQLRANVLPVIPEPATALMMGLGLAGLASVGRRPTAGSRA